MLKKNEIKNDVYNKFNLIEQIEVKFLTTVSFILLALIGAIFSICDPFNPIIAYTNALIIFINLILIIVINSNPKKYRFFYELYVGINCLSIGVVSLLSYLKIIYLTLEIKSFIFCVLSISIYITLLLFFFIASRRKYNDQTFFKSKVIAPFVSIMPIIGFVVARVIKEHTSQDMGVLILSHFLLALAYITTIGVEKIYLFYKIKLFLNDK